MTSSTYLNAFTRLTQESVALGEMQVANPRHGYPLADASLAQPEIDITVRVGAIGPTASAVFRSPETGYFERDGNYYYRNCNVANATVHPEVFYKGRLPNSFLCVRLSDGDRLTVTIETTRNFVRESRSRFTRIASLDQTVNHILLAASVLRGYMPMHAAAFEAGGQGGRRSVLFMGLPNTGKTNTSVAVSKLLKGDYLAEDICFIRPDTLGVFGGPFTLDETKLQNYDALRARKYVGAPATVIVMLERRPTANDAERIPAGDPRIENFLIEMNRYEFEWNHDLVLRHLMLGGSESGFNIANITRLYFEGLKRVAERLSAIKISGNDPSGWAPLLARALPA